MPKLPQSLASGEVPGYIQGGQANPRAWAATGIALGNFGEMAEQESAKWNAIEQKLKASREAVFTSQVLSDLDTHKADFLSKIGSDKSGKAVSDAWKTSATAFLAQRLSGVDDEKVRNAVLARSILHVADGANDARRVANSKVMESTQNSALLQIKDLENKGTEEANTEARDLIRGLTEAGVFSAEAGTAREDMLRKGSAQNAFARILAADPTEALRVVNERKGMFSSLDDAEVNRLRGAARSEIEHQASLARQLRVDREHAEHLATLKVQEESDDARLDAAVKVANGQYSVLQLEKDARLYRWKPDQYEHLRELMVNPKGRASDPETLQQAMLRSRSTRVTQHDRDWLAVQYSAKRLNAEDYAKVDNEAQSNLRSLKDESKSDLARSHAQAEQELQASLGITGMLETLTHDQKKAYASALSELTDRSSFMRGKEDPIAVVREIAPKYQSIITEGAALTIDQKTRLLKYKTPQELTEAFQAGKLTKQSYDIERQRFLDIGAYLPPMLRANMGGESSKPKGNPSLKREPK